MRERTGGFIDSAPLVGDGKALRRRANEEGYLFFRGLLPREEVLALRSEILALCGRRGWLAEGHERSDGVVNSDAIDAIDPEAIRSCGVGIPPEAYRDVWKLEAFHRLAHNRALIDLYHSLFEADVLVHPRNIARVMLPTRHSSPTPPHQDYIHIQGTKNVRTAWVPIGDVSRELGGLTVLRGSHTDGILPVKAAEGAGNLEAYLCNTGYEWVHDEFRAGDVLTFSSLTVHKALPNTLGDRLRISCDFRFQPADESVEKKSLLPHCGVATWEEIYEEWQDESLQYYWTKMDLVPADWDESILWQQEKIC